MSLPIETIAWIVAGSFALVGIVAAASMENKIKKEADNMLFGNDIYSVSDMLLGNDIYSVSDMLFGNGSKDSQDGPDSPDSLAGKKRKNKTKRLIHNKGRKKSKGFNRK